MRALVASLLRRELPSDDKVRRVVAALLSQGSSTREDRLDFLRVLGLLQKQVEADAGLKRQTAEYLLKDFPSPDRNIRWEQVRLLGEFRVAAAFPGLLELIETERDEVTQFHIGLAISKLAGGWTAAEEQRLLR